MARWELVCLGLILLVSIALSFLGLGQGLPHVLGADEGFEIHRALKLGQGEIDFDRVLKGGFFYILFVEYGLYFVWLKLTGQIATAGDFAMRFASDRTPFWLMARTTHALMGVLVVMGSYLLGRRFYGRQAGLIASAIVAVSPLVVQRSHYVGVDIPMTFLVLTTMALAYSWSDECQRPRPLLLGLSFGGAVMTKAPAIVLLIPIALANWLRWHRASLRKAVFNRQILGAYGIALGFLVLGNPGLPTQLSGAVLKLFGPLFSAASSLPVDEVFAEAGLGTNQWVYYFRCLGSALGPPTLSLFLVGLGVAIWKHNRVDCLLLSFMVPFYIVISSVSTSHLYYPRYILPLVPLAGILAARALAGEDFRLYQKKWPAAGLLVLVSLLLVSPTLASWGWVKTIRRAYTQVEAKSWIERNVPAGSTIFLIGNPLANHVPALSVPLENSTANLQSLIEASKDRSRSKATLMQMRISSAPAVTYDLRTVWHSKPNPSLSELLNDGVQYLVLTDRHFGPSTKESDTKRSSRVLQSRAQLLQSVESSAEIELVFEIDPRESGNPGPRVRVFKRSGS